MNRNKVKPVIFALPFCVLCTPLPAAMPKETHVNDDVQTVPSGVVVVDTNDVKPPDGGYGWLVCIAMCVINAFTWGVLASYGVFLSYYLSNDIFPGATSINYAFVGGSNFGAAMIVAPAMSHLIRLLGTRITIIVGCVIYAGGFIAASFAKQFWQLVLSQGVMVGFGVGIIWQPVVPLLPQWFLRNRSLAQGLSSCGSGFGGIIFSLATTPMINNLGLAWALRITGLVSFVMLMLAAIVIRDRNALIKPKVKFLDIKLFNTGVLLLLGWSVFSILGYIVLLYSLSSYAISIGLTQKQGGMVIALQNLGTALGRPFVGVLSDRLGRMTVAAFLTFFTGVISFVIWIPATSYGVLLFFGVVSGATLGTFWSTIAPLCAEVVDLVDLPSMLSITWVIIVLPTLFSEVIALELRRPSSSEHPYLYAQIYTGLCYLVATGFLLELKRRKWGLFTREKHR